MTSRPITYMHEQPVHEAAIEMLNAQAFGPARFTRAAHLIREEGPHDLSLSFVACEGERINGFVRMTPVAIGRERAVLLGPIVVDPACKSSGIGAGLMQKALDAARAAGYQLVVLVGDEPYYRRFGFRHVPGGRMILPAPVNPGRLLACELAEGALEPATGLVRHISRA